MRSIFIILKRELFGFSKNIVAKISWLFFQPLILFTVIVLPLNKMVHEVNGLNFLNWAAPGIWIASAFLSTYITSFYRINYVVKNSQVLQVYLSSPVSIWSLQTAITIWSILIGLIQLLLSMILIGLINYEVYTLLKWSGIFLSIVPIILFSAVTGNILGTWIRNSFSASYLSVTVILLFLFGSGIFIPYGYFPGSFTSAVKYFPVIQSIVSVQDIVIYSRPEISGMILLLVLSLFIFIVNGSLTQKLIRK